MLSLGQNAPSFSDKVAIAAKGKIGAIGNALIAKIGCPQAKIPAFKTLPQTQVKYIVAGILVVVGGIEKIAAEIEPFKFGSYALRGLVT